MGVPLSYFTTTNPYQGHRYSSVFPAPRYHFEDITDTVGLDAPQPTSNPMKRLFYGAFTLGGLLLVGLAFKRYCPGLSAQVAGFIPGSIKNSFNRLVASRAATSLGHYAQSVLGSAQALLSAIKASLGGLLSKVA